MRAGQDIPDDIILELASHPNFLGVKECTGNQRIQSYHDKVVGCGRTGRKWEERKEEGVWL